MKTLKECMRLAFCGFAYTIAIALLTVVAFTFYYQVYLPLGGFVVAMGLLCLALVLAVIKSLEVFNEDLSGPHNDFD